MDNLLLTLGVGALIIAVFHLLMRLTSRVGHLTLVIVTLIFIAGLYTPLLIFDWPGIDIFAIQIAIYGITVYLLSILHHQSIQKKSLPAKEQTKASRLHWGPVAIISFFVVVIAVDSVFITLAQKGGQSGSGLLFIPEPKSGGKVSSFFPGIIEHNFHEKEDMYNEHQKRLEEQRKRGWQVKYGWLNKPQANKAVGFKLVLKNARQQPISGAKVKGSFQRGNTSKQDQPVSLKETSPGNYQADVILKYPGRWQLVLKITSPQGDYDLKATTEISE